MFGDGQDYDWAMEGEEGMDVEEGDEPPKKDLRLEDVRRAEGFHWTLTALRFSTQQRSRPGVCRMRTKPSLKMTGQSDISSSTPPFPTIPFFPPTLSTLHLISPPVGPALRYRCGHNICSAAYIKMALIPSRPSKYPTHIPLPDG